MFSSLGWQLVHQRSVVPPVPSPGRVGCHTGRTVRVSSGLLEVGHGTCTSSDEEEGVLVQESEVWAQVPAPANTGGCLGVFACLFPNVARQQKQMQSFCGCLGSRPDLNRSPFLGWRQGTWISDCMPSSFGGRQPSVFGKLCRLACLWHRVSPVLVQLMPLWLSVCAPWMFTSAIALFLDRLHCTHVQANARL